MKSMEIMNLNQYINNIPQIISLIATISYIMWGISIIKEDLVEGKIKNKKIILGFKIISVLLIASFINTIYGYVGKVTNYLNFIFYKYYIIHFFYSFIFSIILWYGEIWPAGDSKFFIINLLFIPLIKYDIYGFPGYIWISTLINIFIISAFFSIFYYIRDNITMLKNQDSNAFKEIKNFYINKIKTKKIYSSSAIFMIFSVLSIFLYKQMFNILLTKYVFNLFHRTDIFFFLMFFLWPKLSEFLKSRYWKYIMVLLYTIFIFLIFMMPSPLEFIKITLTTAIKNTFKFGTIFFLGKILFEHIIEAHNSYYASSDEIKPGMILSSMELNIIKNNEVFNGIFDDTFKDGLNEEQVETLKKWMKKHPDKNVKLKFVKARPFAFQIFIGCLFEIIFNKNLVQFIK